MGLCLASVGCSGRSADDALGERQSPIVGGTIDYGDPAVVAIWIGDGECTGTLISPRVVLTAAHCFEGADASQMQVFFGTDFYQDTTWIPVVDAESHPSADIAALTMAWEGPAAPIPLTNHGLVASDKGRPVRIVGFGVTSETGEDSGLKLQATTHIVEWDADFVYIDGHGKDTCYGDSGGPALVAFDGVESVAGVTSFGTAACGTDMSGETRVDVYRGWVEQYVATHDASPLPSPPPPKPEPSHPAPSGHAGTGGGKTVGTIGESPAASSAPSSCAASDRKPASSGFAIMLGFVLVGLWRRRKD